MTSLLLRSSLLLACIAIPAVAQPRVDALQNNYSYLLADDPDYGIARGSIFIIYGVNLSNTTTGLQSSTEPPFLQTTLNGVSAQVTVEGVTTDVIWYYLTPTQLGGILPSATPAGNGAIVVNNNGQVSAPAPIKVVDSAFGVLTLNGSGSGAAAVYDANYQFLGPARSARPGDGIQFFGTGLGPATGSETMQAPPVDLTQIPITATIGGTPATVLFRGRIFPGLDQVNLLVPNLAQAATTRRNAFAEYGCNIPVVITIGDYGRVLRGAYTISSFMEGTGTNLRMPLNPPFNVEFETLYDKGDALLLPQSNISQGLTVLQALDPFKGVNIRLWDPNVRPANVQQWSLIVERQLPEDTVVTVGYVGQHGTHLVVPMPYYQLRLNADGTTQPSGYLSGNPQLSQITQISGTESNGNQRYDSLQVTARRRMTSGFEYQLAYTYSKGMSDAIGYYGEGGQAANQSAYWQNLFDRPSEWGPTYFDATHAFTYSYVYELPFGRNKAFGANWNPVVNGVLGGWQMGGILTLRSGFPWTVTATDVSRTRSRGARADHVGADSTIGDVGPGTKWFDTTAYRAPVTGTFGNTGVGTVRGPGLKNFDLSLQKSFAVKEGQRLEFRAEFFNLTNTPAFNAAQRSVNSATFGEITSAQGERNIQFALKFYF